MRTIVALLCALALTGCAAVLCDVDAQKEPKTVTLPDSKGRVATFRYLGAGGWVIRRDDDVVLTAPFFSNPSLWTSLAARRNDKAIEEQMQYIDVKDVDVIVAAHAHYDHLLDLPYILPKIDKNAKMVGGKTVCNTLHAALKDRDCAREFTSDRIRIRAFDSEHAPHGRFGIKLQRTGGYCEPLERVPTRTFGYKEGEPLAFLIDFMEGNEIALRVYYADSGANPGKGIPPLDDGKAIDVAILCVASFSYVKNQPTKIIEELKEPKHLLLGHWENFFWPARNPGCRVPLTNVNAYLAAVQGQPHTLPDRRTLITVVY